MDKWQIAPAGRHIRHFSMNVMGKWQITPARRDVRHFSMTPANHQRLPRPHSFIDALS